MKNDKPIEQKAIELFRTTQNNSAIEIARKLGTKVSRVNTYINRYLEGKTIGNV